MAADPGGGGGGREGDVFEGGEKSKSLRLSPPFPGSCWARLAEMNSWEWMFFHP